MTPGRAALAILALAALSLAGCSEGKEDGGAPAPDAPKQPALHGWVFDAAFRPQAGAEVAILETNATTTTDLEGHYAFPDAERGTAVVLVVNQPGFVPKSKLTNVPVEEDSFVILNFTLEAVPTKVASREVLEFQGRIVCQAAVADDQGSTVSDCSGGTGPQAGQADAWEFAVQPELAGAIIEVHFEAGTPFGQTLGARLETLGLGSLNVVLSQVVGTNPLHLPVGQDLAEKYYASGGRMRLTVFAEPDNEANEAGVGASLSVQQDFEAFASLFYVEPPSPTYTVADGA